MVHEAEKSAGAEYIHNLTTPITQGVFVEEFLRAVEWLALVMEAKEPITPKPIDIILASILVNAQNLFKVGGLMKRVELGKAINNADLLMLLTNLVAVAGKDSDYTMKQRVTALEAVGLMGGQFPFRGVRFQKVKDGIAALLSRDGRLKDEVLKEVSVGCRWGPLQIALVEESQFKADAGRISRRGERHWTRDRHAIRAIA